jgi:hypothetical protein
MIMNGQIVETNKTLILAPLYVLDKLQEWLPILIDRHQSLFHYVQNIISFVILWKYKLDMN